jgi:polyisoprenoid-binding protein YceI
MKKLLFAIGLMAITQASVSQVFFTRTGKVGFFSHTDVEDIKAENNEAVSFLDAAKGEFRFQTLIKGFRFPKASMEQHFNSSSYMDSDQFPKSEFKGSIKNPTAVNFKKDGTYKVEVEGDLTMHGVTKKIKVPGTITVQGGKVSANAVFMVNRTDFGIKVPSFTAAKISENIQVTVNCAYEPYTNG